MGLQRALLRKLSAYELGLVDQCLHLRERVARGGAHLGAPLEDAQRFLAAGNRALRQGQALIEAAQGQIVQRHLFDETGLNGMLRGIQRQIVAQGGIAETFDTAPEVELPAVEAHKDLLIAGDDGAAAGIEVGGHACSGMAAAQADRRQPGRALDAVGRLGLLHAQQRQAPVLVMRQCRVDQLLQGWVQIEVLPGNGRSRCRRDGRRLAAWLRRPLAGQYLGLRLQQRQARAAGCERGQQQSRGQQARQRGGNAV